MEPVEEGRKPLIFVLCGPGGVGKGTLVSRLFELRDGLWLSRSWTTRPQRPHEAAGSYHFTTRAAFEARIAAGGFLEWTEFAGNGQLYGTPTLEPPPGHDVVLEIEVDGAAQVAQRYPEAVLVLIVAPSRQDQEYRLRARGDDEASVERRLAVGATEEEIGRRMASHVIVNDDVERASQELAGIVDFYRHAPGHDLP